MVRLKRKPQFLQTTDFHSKYAVQKYTTQFLHTLNKYFLMGHSRPLFIDFHFFNTVDRTFTNKFSDDCNRPADL